MWSSPGVLAPGVGSYAFGATPVNMAEARPARTGGQPPTGPSSASSPSRPGKRRAISTFTSRSMSSAVVKASSRATSARPSDAFAARITRFTSGIDGPFIDSSDTPSPTSTSAFTGSPAISPHIDTGIPASRPAAQTRSSIRSTARWSGLYRYATSLFCRSIPIVYWMRSFVPMEKKSHSRASRSAISAALGSSIMMPTGMSFFIGPPVRMKKDIPVGIMIELPSAALIADRLARECDFFSIGTNDLIQYTIGIDRQNKDVAYLYKPLHLAVLRMLDLVCAAGREAGIPVSMCGEMAGEPVNALVLVGHPQH